MNCALLAKAIVDVSARIMLICKQLSRSDNYLSRSCQQSSIQPIRSWYQELVSWNGGINGMHTPSSPDRSRFIPFALDCTRLSPTGACLQAKAKANPVHMRCQCFYSAVMANSKLDYFNWGWSLWWIKQQRELPKIARYLKRLRFSYKHRSLLSHSFGKQT